MSVAVSILRGPRKEVTNMEGMFLGPEYLSGMGPLIAGGLLLAMVITAVVYGWLHEEPSRAAEREPLKKAA
jgi:hypothetical protein